MWVPNWLFLTHVNETIQFLNTLTLLRKYSVAFEPITESTYMPIYHPEKLIINKNNITCSLPQTNNETELYEIARENYGRIAGETADFTFCITYSPLDYNTSLSLYITLNAVIKHLWFTKEVLPNGSEPKCLNRTSFLNFSEILLSLLIILPLVSVKKLNKRKLIAKIRSL